ncbi:MAG: hypothetical protein PWQ17_868 [Anaerophaga sp.]|nr:hypothetical protein [Anaerophaga sp.]MDK2841363.1 hypothetical protein [Anaerophaga sp.]MDN5291099.1 hypothetical protein [Anaerophaga sp.]
MGQRVEAVEMVFKSASTHQVTVNCEINFQGLIKFFSFELFLIALII